MKPISSDSASTMTSVCPRVRPMLRSIPISLVRSTTFMVRVLTTPKAPTIMAMMAMMSNML